MSALSWASSSAFCRRPLASSSSPATRRRPPPLLRVVDGSKGTKACTEPTTDRSESDRLVDGIDFGELCNDFECISSPSVESTARQLARDILELREGNRSLGCFSISVKYKDPVRTFIGREKYKRLFWATDALENPMTKVVKGIVEKLPDLRGIKDTLSESAQ